MEEGRHKIYRLRDPLGKQIRYVGRTNHPEQRLREHSLTVMECLCSIQKSEWIKGLRRNGLVPEMEVIEEVDNGQVRRRETYWIGYHILQGDDLLNDEASKLSLVKVKGWRMLRGLSRQELSKATGIPVNIIGKIESSRDYRPFIGNLYSIANALVITVDDLMTSESVVAPSFIVGEKALWIVKSRDYKQEICREVTVTGFGENHTYVKTHEPVHLRDEFAVSASDLFKIA